MSKSNGSKINMEYSEKDTVYDVTIIGGGAVGLFTAFYSGLRGMKTKVIEADEELGGKVTMGFPEKSISDVGGIKEITGSKLVQELIQQAKTFDPTILCSQWISDLQQVQDGIFRLTSHTGEIHYTRTIILTIGNGIIKPIKLDMDDVERYENSDIHYAVDEFSQFKDKNVLISGGGDSAVDWANELYSIAKSVTVVHRRDEFRAFENSVHKMKEQVDVLTPYTVRNLQGEEDQLKQVALENLKTGKNNILMLMLY